MVRINPGNYRLLSIALVISLTSCTTFKASGLSVILSDDPYDVIGYMDETIHINKFLGTSGGATFANITEDATDSRINSAVSEQLSKYGGDAIIDMNIKYRASLLDSLGNYITFTLWAPSTAHITGTIIKYKK